MVEDLRKTRLVLQTATQLQQHSVTMPGFDSIPGRQEMLSVMCSHEFLRNLIDLPLFSHLWNGNNYMCLHSNIILDFKDEHCMPDSNGILLCSLNKYKFSLGQKLQQILRKSMLNEMELIHIAMWPHMFPLVLSQNKLFPELSVVEQIFVISMGTIRFIKICLMLTDFFPNHTTPNGGELYKMLNDWVSFFVLLREWYTDPRGDKAEWTLKANAYLRFCASLQSTCFHIYIPINALIPVVFIYYVLLLI